MNNFYMNIAKILQGMPDSDLSGRELHKYVFRELAGMFSDCVLDRYTGTPSFKTHHVVDKPGKYEKCNIITFSNIYSRLIVDGINYGKLSFGHDGIDAFFIKCYESIGNFEVKRPDLYQRMKIYLNSTFACTTGPNAVYPIHGDIQKYFDEHYFDKVHAILNSPKNVDNHILVFDVDTFILDSRVPALETDIQIGIGFSNSVYQSDVELTNGRGKKYKIKHTSGVLE